MKLTQKILDRAVNNPKTELGVGFGGEPKPKKKVVPMRNDAQAYNQYPKLKALEKAKK